MIAHFEQCIHAFNEDAPTYCILKAYALPATEKGAITGNCIYI